MSQLKKIPPEYLNTLTHFYRGEIQRSTDWRRRLDLTTNWAILATTAAFASVFSARETESAHVVLVFTSHLVFLLMCIEARRFRYYDVWNTRARMLEVHLLVPALNPDLEITQGDWREVLSNDLLLPRYKISFLESLGRRLHANYIWLFLGLLGGWVLRVYTEAAAAVRPQGAGSPSLSDTVAACGYEGVIPAWLIIGLQVLFWGFIVGIFFCMWKSRNVSGEIRRRNPKAKEWPI